MEYASFFEFLKYVRRNRMCTMPGCTTCGCLPFRRYCMDEIGYDEMCRLIKAVTAEEAAGIYPDFWYEPLRIIYDVVFEDLPEEAPLMQEYFRIRSILLEAKARRAAAGRAKCEAEQERARIRRAEHEKLAAEHRERSRIKNEAYRQRLLEQ